MKAIVAFLTSAEKLLDVAIIRQKNPIALVVRTALIREVALCDQILAEMRDGGNCADLHDKLAFNHRIVRIGCAQLVEGIEDAD